MTNESPVTRPEAVQADTALRHSSFGIPSSLDLRPSSFPGAGVRGHLDLVCAANTEGRSYLRKQSFRAPIHISKPHEEGGTLVVNLINPTAGLLSGDRLRMCVRVESGARLLLTTPSASRVHRMRDGFAEVGQVFRIAPRGWLEVFPEPLIPQAGARYRQSTTLCVERGGEALFFEAIAPGRSASGEVFAYDWLELRMDLFLENKLIVRERNRLSPADDSLAAVRRQFPSAYYASCFAISPRLSTTSSCWAAIHALQESEAWVGCGSLVDGGWTVKLLCGSSGLLRQKLGEIRREIHSALGRPAPPLRRS